MKITTKTTLYTVATTLLVGTLLILYMIFMLPGLYVDYRMRTAEDQYVRLQKNILETNQCPVDSASPNEMYFAIVFPETGYELAICSNFGNGKATILDETIMPLIDNYRFLLSNADNYEQMGDIFNEENLSFIIDYFSSFTGELTAVVDVELYPHPTEDFVESSRFRVINEYSIMLQGSVLINDSHYSSFIGLGNNGTNSYVFFGTMVTPQINEIIPVILESLPMIIAFLCLVAVLAGYIFSKKLADPIAHLAGEATKMKNFNQYVELIDMNRKDEFNDLQVSLNSLYQSLKNALELSQKQNDMLLEQKENQELFMMNSSHRLKTPISASLLLVESMINEVGKYKDTKAYLPELKERLFEMQELVYKMLEAVNIRKELKITSIDVNELLSVLLENYQELLLERKLKIEITGISLTIDSDAELFISLLDNIISNAVKYAEQSSQIEIVISANGITISNVGHIEEDLLKHIFEPFVSSSDYKGRGLGLYIVDCYAQYLQMEVSINNEKEKVIAKIHI